MYPLFVSSNHNGRQGNGDITAERLRSEFPRYARLIALLVVIMTALENLLPQLKLDQIPGTGVASNWVDRLLWIDQGCHWLSFVGIGVALFWARGGGAMMVISAFIAGLFEFRPGHGVLEHPLQFPPASTLMLITGGLLFMLSAPTKGDPLGVIGWLQNTQRQLSAFQASSGYRWRHRLISLESFLIATVIIAAAAWLMRTQGVKSLIVVAAVALQLLVPVVWTLKRGLTLRPVQVALRAGLLAIVAAYVLIAICTLTVGVPDFHGGFLRGSQWAVASPYVVTLFNFVLFGLPIPLIAALGGFEGIAVWWNQRRLRGAA